MTASEELARRARADALRMVHRANASHIGSALSMMDILAVLYDGALRVRPSEPGWPERDRLLLSKGHAAAGLYAMLASAGFLAPGELDTYCDDGSRLLGHASHHVPGVEFSTGSLGHGLSVGCGLALTGDPWRVFVLMSDGEIDEGSVWEAAMFAGHHRLDRLVAVVDHNKIQSLDTVKNVLDLAPLAAKWEAFGWAVREVDGHDHAQLSEVFAELPVQEGKPSCVIAHTVKGKGVGFMENRVEWHYKSPDALQLAEALAEIGGVS